MVNSIKKFSYRNVVIFKVWLKKFNMEPGRIVENKKYLL